MPKQKFEIKIGKAQKPKLKKHKSFSTFFSVASLCAQALVLYDKNLEIKTKKERRLRILDKLNQFLREGGLIEEENMETIRWRPDKE